ncbi:MAG: protein-L-isoaspartate O-methyltransferase [Candidatus Moraniibacteriota bacterium]
MEALINYLTTQGYLKTPRIIEAFERIDRADFMLPEFKNSADANVPLPIGFGQTISQPLTVAFMLELLQPKPGDKILDIGSGSGWTTTLLAEIVGRKGKVFGIEIIPELCKFGEKNVGKYNFIKKGIAKITCLSGSKGYEKEALYDKILVSAAAEKFPPELKKQIKIGGRIIIPIKNSIWLIERTGKNKFKEEESYGFSFVPLI